MRRSALCVAMGWQRSGSASPTSSGKKEKTNLTNIFFGLTRFVSTKIALLMASIALLVMLASCGTQPAGTEATNPASFTHNGKIAFASYDNRVGDSEIFV